MPALFNRILFAAPKHLTEESYEWIDRLPIPQGFLTDAQIRLALENEDLIVPGSWDANCIRHASYTLRLGTKVEIASASRANAEEGRDFAVRDLHTGDHFDLMPGDTAKLYSTEMLRLPDCVLGFTVARGLMFFESLIPENTYVDPGFNGSLYTTVTNLSHRVVRLHQNDPIARLFLYKLSEPVRQAYQQGAARGLNSVWNRSGQQSLGRSWNAALRRATI